MGWHATTLIAGPWPHVREHGDAAGPAFAPCRASSTAPGGGIPGQPHIRRMGCRSVAGLPGEREGQAPRCVRPPPLAPVVGPGCGAGAPADGYRGARGCVPGRAGS